MLVGPASDKAQLFGYLSKIEFSAVDPYILRCLKRTLEPDSYKISTLEIALDIFFETEREAIESLLEMENSVRKKYVPTVHYYDNNKVSDEKWAENYARQKKLNGEVFYNKTLYYGAENFKYVVYVRYSKMNGHLCLHCEWRLRGAALIKKKTGINNINDLINFDFEKFFTEQESKQLLRSGIDRDKLGKWLLGLSRRKKFSEQELQRIRTVANLFCHFNNIKTSAQLANYFRNEKKHILAKAHRRTAYDNKILKIDDYSRFEVPYNNVL